jgi:hypothetical protein
VQHGIDVCAFCSGQEVQVNVLEGLALPASAAERAKRKRKTRPTAEGGRTTLKHPFRPLKSRKKQIGYKIDLLLPACD